MKDILNISIEEASMLIKKSAEYVRQAVENGKFGTNLGIGERGNYHIPRLAFYQYMGIPIPEELADEAFKKALEINAEAERKKEERKSKYGY